MTTSKDIKSVLDALLSCINSDDVNAAEALREVPAVQTAHTAMVGKKFDEFYYAVQYPVENVLRGMLETQFPDQHRVHFLFLQSQFVAQQLEWRIRETEGSPCCVDKTSTVMRAIFKFLATGVEVAFDYTQEYTYHLPKTVFAQHKEVMEFFEAVYALYYGNPTRYLQVIPALPKCAAR